MSTARKNIICHAALSVEVVNIVSGNVLVGKSKIAGVGQYDGIRFVLHGNW